MAGRFLLSKRIASVKGCPVTVMGDALADLALSPEILNAAIPAPPSRSTRGRLAMRAFAASCTGFGWLSAGAAAAAVVPVAGAPTAAGGGAVRLMQPAPPAAHTRSKQVSRRHRSMRAE